MVTGAADRSQRGGGDRGRLLVLHRGVPGQGEPGGVQRLAESPRTVHSSLGSLNMFFTNETKPPKHLALSWLQSWLCAMGGFSSLFSAVSRSLPLAVTQRATALYFKGDLSVIHVLSMVINIHL